VDHLDIGFTRKLAIERMVLSAVLIIVTVLEGKSGWCFSVGNKVKTGGDHFKAVEDDSKYEGPPTNQIFDEASRIHRRNSLLLLTPGIKHMSKDEMSSNLNKLLSEEHSISLGVVQ